MKAKDSYIESAADAAALFRAALPKEQKEERVFVLPLDANGKVLAKPILVSVGSEDGTTAIDPGAIFRAALKAEAEEIIVAHNHPSGDPTPSKADRETTAKLNDGAKLVGLELLDHIILGAPETSGDTPRETIVKRAFAHETPPASRLTGSVGFRRHYTPLQKPLAGPQN